MMLFGGFGGIRVAGWDIFGDDLTQNFPPFFGEVCGWEGRRWEKFCVESVWRVFIDGSICRFLCRVVVVVVCGDGLCSAYRVSQVERI
jgi:hypothetical protein